MEIANLSVMANRLKKHIDDFVEITETDGDDLSEEEIDMYKKLKEASAYIDDYLRDKQMIGRVFEVGKSYYSDIYDIVTVKSRTERTVTFFEGHGHQPITGGDNERTSGWRTIRA